MDEIKMDAASADEHNEAEGHGGYTFDRCPTCHPNDPRLRPFRAWAYEIERRGMRDYERAMAGDQESPLFPALDALDDGEVTWADEQAATRRRSGIDGPGVG